MTLLDIISDLGGVDEADTIYAKKPWNPHSTAVVAKEPNEGGAPEDARRFGLDYFLEVGIAKSFLEDWPKNAQFPHTSEDKCNRIISYALYDA